jgi:hypothetical protein
VDVSSGNSSDFRQHFVASYVTGEGSFDLTLSEHQLGQTRVSCASALKVRADDLELVRLVWRALDFAGNIHHSANYRYRYAQDPIRRHDAVMLIVRDRRELTGRVIPFFDRYPLQGMKRRNCEIWKQAVYLLEAGEHRSPDGLDEIRALRAQLNQYQGKDETPPEAGADEAV